MKLAIVTGAAGFLGSHLAMSLMQDQFAVIGIDNFCTGQERNIELLREQKNFHFIEGDVCDPEIWKSVRKLIAAQDFELAQVYHFASPASPPHYQRLNIETMMVNSNGLLECLNFATSLGGRVVFASTSEVYGDPAVHPQTEDYWGNVNSFGARACYDEAKRFGEALIYSFNERHGTKHGLVRIFNTYGPRMNPNDGRVVINFLVQALRGENLTIYGDGQQTRSFCYVDDLIAGIRKYAASELIEPVNLGNPGEFTVLELAEVVRGFFPEKNLQMEFLKIPKDDPKQRRPNIAKAKQLLGWEPRIILRDGLQKMRQELELLIVL